MKVESLIAVGGLLAAIFSALAAAFAVKQSKLQRTVLTKPQIVITNVKISLSSEESNLFTLGYKEGLLFLPVKNVGLGTALNLKYTWKFDYLKALDACGFSHFESSSLSIINSNTNNKDPNTVYVEHTTNDNYLFIHFFKNEEVTGFVIKNNHSEIEYLIPITQDKTEVKIKIPYLIPLLTINQLKKNDFIPNENITNNTPITLIIDYEDISGSRFSISFLCTINLIMKQGSSINDIEADYELRFQRNLEKNNIIKKACRFFRSS